MTYLLDTHYMLWATMETKKLPPAIREVMSDPANRIVVSAVSFWEVALKYAIGKLELEEVTPAELPRLCQQMGFLIENLSVADASN